MLVILIFHYLTFFLNKIIADFNKKIWCYKKMLYNYTNINHNLFKLTLTKF